MDPLGKSLKVKEQEAQSKSQWIVLTMEGCEKNVLFPPRFVLGPVFLNLFIDDLELGVSSEMTSN